MIGHSPGESHPSAFSICYAHCSVPHIIFCWLACSERLYIVGCPGLCCRASGWGSYGSLCRKLQIGLQKLTGNHASLVTIFDMLSEVKQLTGTRGGSRLAPLLGVAQAMVVLCLISIFHIVCKCGTGGVLVCSSPESQSPSLASLIPSISCGFCSLWSMC